MQLIGLLVIAIVGATNPRLVLAIYVPLIVISAVCAAAFMDNITSVRNDTGALREAVRDPQTWVMSFLYIGTFGWFIGYSFARGLVLQNQFGRTPLQATAVVFIGPLIGSVIRPVGGWLADRYGGAKVTVMTFIGMALATAVVIMASNQKSLPLFVAAFLALFMLSGIGNGSTYKMIPSIFDVKTRVAIAAGAASQSALMTARRRAGAVIGIAGSVGAMGGVFINGACVLVTYVIYLRRAPAATAADQPRLAYARV